MAKNKYEKYINYDQEYVKEHPPGSMPGFIGVSIGKEQVKEAKVHCGYAWYLGSIPKNGTYKPHYHDSDEIITIIGTDPNDAFNLGGEVDFWFEHEKYTITRTCMIYIPAGVQHAPLWFRKVNRPIISGTVNLGEGLIPIPTKNPDPMFSEFKDIIKR
jgi:hypothetical protein